MGQTWNESSGSLADMPLHKHKFEGNFAAVQRVTLVTKKRQSVQVISSNSRHLGMLRQCKSSTVRTELTTLTAALSVQGTKGSSTWKECEAYKRETFLSAILPVWYTWFSNDPFQRSQKLPVFKFHKMKTFHDYSDLFRHVSELELFFFNLIDVSFLRLSPEVPSALTDTTLESMCSLIDSFNMTLHSAWMHRIIDFHHQL